MASKDKQRIYTIDELINTPFDDIELNQLLKSKSLLISIIVGMFKFTKSKLDTNQIIELTKQNNWFNKKHWNWKEHDEFLVKVAKIYHNLFRTSEYESYYTANVILSKYGFIVKDNKQNENKHFNRLLKYEL